MTGESTGSAMKVSSLLGQGGAKLRKASSAPRANDGITIVFPLSGADFRCECRLLEKTNLRSRHDPIPSRSWSLRAILKQCIAGLLKVPWKDGTLSNPGTPLIFCNEHATVPDFCYVGKDAGAGLVFSYHFEPAGCSPPHEES